ncbi:MAG: transposase [Clostridiales bacterium]|nr:transposase [Clostridiales bacterium]
MSFKINKEQQLTLDDRFLKIDERTKKFVLNSWAKGFSEIIFPAINEERFSVLYSENKGSRPNNPVNTVVGSLILKELLNLTDDELLASILCDVRFQYALHTTSFKEQPFSDRTFSRFRERLYQYTLETGNDLLQEEMESMATVFMDYLKIEPGMKRMDSVMVASSCKTMTRLEILYTCTAKMIKTLHQSHKMMVSKNLAHYLEDDDLNRTIYHQKNDNISARLQQVIDDASRLIAEFGNDAFELPEYQLLQRVLTEQTESDPTGKSIPKDKKSIAPQSLQNPSDPDATFRRKAGKKHKGYVGNIIETFDVQGALITGYDYDINSHSDSQFCKETIEKMGFQEKPTTLLADGAYASTDNHKEAAKNNVELITTALLGKIPNLIQGEFIIDSVEHEVRQCPAGNKPYKTSYYDETGMYRASFNKKTCENCPLNNQCGVKFQKKSAVVMVSEKMIQRATYLKKMSTDEYRVLSKKRNAVEGIPSVLRRRYHVDHIPVRGLVRTKIWFGFKIGAINAKRVLKGAAVLLQKLNFSQTLHYFLPKHYWGRNNLSLAA